MQDRAEDVVERMKKDDDSDGRARRKDAGEGGLVRSWRSLDGGRKRCEGRGRWGELGGEGNNEWCWWVGAERIGVGRCD